MKTKTNILIFLLTLVGCGKTRNESEGISKVTVAFSGIGCEGKCPFQVLSVDKNLNAKFYGGQFANRNGYFKGIVSQETWNSIQKRFDKFIVKGIDTIKFKKTDYPYVEFYVHNGFRNHKTRFYENTGKMSNKDLSILNWFINIVSRINLIETDSITFETSIQFPTSPEVMINKKSK